jgi:hypothetical protein
VPRAVEKPTTPERLTLSEARALLTAAYRLPQDAGELILEALADNRIHWWAVRVKPPGSPPPADLWQRALKLPSEPDKGHGHQQVDWANSRVMVLLGLSPGTVELAFDYITVTVMVARADVEALLPADYVAPSPSEAEDWLEQIERDDQGKGERQKDRAPRRHIQMQLAYKRGEVKRVWSAGYILRKLQGRRK